MGTNIHDQTSHSHHQRSPQVPALHGRVHSEEFLLTVVPTEAPDPTVKSHHLLRLFHQLQDRVHLEESRRTAVPTVALGQTVLFLLDQLQVHHLHQLPVLMVAFLHIAVPTEDKVQTVLYHPDQLQGQQLHTRPALSLAHMEEYPHTAALMAEVVLTVPYRHLQLHLLRLHDLVHSAVYPHIAALMEEQVQTVRSHPRLLPHRPLQDLAHSEACLHTVVPMEEPVQTALYRLHQPHPQPLLDHVHSVEFLHTAAQMEDLGQTALFQLRQGLHRGRRVVTTNISPHAPMVDKVQTVFYRLPHHQPDHQANQLQVHALAAEFLLTAVPMEDKARTAQCRPDLLLHQLDRPAVLTVASLLTAARMVEAVQTA